LPDQVRSKSNGSSVAAAQDDMDESDLMVVSLENPVVFEGEAGEVGRIIMICFADTDVPRPRPKSKPKP